MSCLWRVALLCGLLMCASVARGQARHALVVGVDDYKFVRSESKRLHGMALDLQRIQFMLRYFGFKPEDIVRLSAENATGARIRRAMDAMVSRVKPGDQVFFYFTGRGSVAYDPGQPARKTDLEPTLVPYDGAADRAGADLRIGELERWATRLEAQRATLTIMLDACFRGQSYVKGEGRAWKDVPRGVARPAGQQGTDTAVRSQLYQGPGILLAATSPRGRAYEWLESLGSSGESWSGVFTDLFVNTALRIAEERQKQHPSPGEASAGVTASPLPTYGEVMAEVQRFIASRSRGGDYLTGQTPLLESRPADSRNSPLFSASSAPPPPPPAEVKHTVEQEVSARKRAEQLLRVVVDVPGVDDATRARLLGGLQKPLNAYIARRLPDVTLVPKYAARPDRVLFVQPHGKGVDVWVAGDEVDALFGVRVSAPDITAAMDRGIATYLERKALVLRLFRLTEAPSDQTLKVNWSARTERATYKNGDEDLAYVITCEKSALFYLMDQDNDGIVQLVWPSYLFAQNRQGAGEMRWPPQDAEAVLRVMAPGGQTLNRAVLIVLDDGVTLPSLDPPSDIKQWYRLEKGDHGKRVILDPRYSPAESRHLRALLDAVKSNRAHWAAITFTYAVSP